MRRLQSFHDFSGGIDLVTPPIDLDPRFTPYAVNARIQGDGSIAGLLGDGGLHKDLVSTAIDATYFRTAAGVEQVICATGSKWINVTGITDMVRSTAVLTDIVTGLTFPNDPASVSFATFNDKLYGLDTYNNVRTWDGTTAATFAPGVSTGPPKGIILGIWEGKMWVAKANASNKLAMEIVWSDVFDATNGFVNALNLWPTANTVTLGGSSSSGSEVIVAAAVTPDGLAVFTNRAQYLIYDSDTGFNTLVDTSGGLTERRALAQDGEWIYGINSRGVWRANGRLPFEYLSDRIGSLFDTQSPFMAPSGLSVECVAGVVFDGSYWVTGRSIAPGITLPGLGLLQTNPRMTIEVKLDTGAVMLHGAPMDGSVYVVMPATSSYGPRLLRLAGEQYGTAEGTGTLPYGRYLRSCLVMPAPLPTIVPAPASTAMVYCLPPLLGEFEQRLHRVLVVGRDPQYEMTAGVSGMQSFAAAAHRPATSADTVNSVRWKRGDWSTVILSDEGFANIAGVRGRALAIGVTAASNYTVAQSIAAPSQVAGKDFYGAGFNRIDVLLSESRRGHR